MSDIHMGELLEKAIRRKGLNITKIASTLGVTRRTLYNWFKQEVIDQQTMEKISQIVADVEGLNMVDIPISRKLTKPAHERDEAYWQARYIDLLERYSKLINEINSKDNRY